MKMRFRIWVWEIAHGCTPFMSRMLMLETCAGVTEASSWAELGAMIDKGISVDGQKVSRIEFLGDESLGSMRSTGEFYTKIVNAEKRGETHPYYSLPQP